MKTTETIIADLQAQRAEHEQAGRLVDARQADQEIIAHDTLARFRARRGQLVAAGEATVDVDEQIRFWRGHVTEDVDQVPDQPAAASEQAAGPASTAARKK